MKTNYILLLLALFAAFPIHAELGYVETIGQERFTGDIVISSGALEVTDTNRLATNKVGIAQLKTMCLLPSNTNASAARGVLLINGTCFAGKVEAADDTVLRFPKSSKIDPVSMHRIARILLRPVPDSAFQTVSSRRGLLLRNNDFVDGELKALKDGRIKIESVLFGSRTFQASDVAAIVLRDAEPAECRFEVRTRDNSLLRLSDVTLAKNEFVLSEPILGSWRLRASDLLALKRN